MKRILKNVKCIVFACCFSSILNVDIANAQELNKCSDWKDAEFCSTYKIITIYTEDLREEEITNYSLALPVLIEIMESDESDINFYATFQLLLALIDTHKDFFQSTDYYEWKRKLIIQLLKYQDQSGDKTRAQGYLLYLFLDVEPIGSMQTSGLAPMITRKTLSENTLVTISCFVKNDLPYLPSDQVEKLDSYKECLRQSVTDTQQ